MTVFVAIFGIHSCVYVQASGAVPAPVKRLALDHDLTKPVPKAVESISGDDNSLDADLSALYDERAHRREDSAVNVSAYTRLSMLSVHVRPY